MSAQVRPGYKLTEVGAIPEDWELSELSAVSMTSSGTTPARSLADRYYRNGTINWVKTLDLNNSEIDDTDELVTQAALEETCLRIYPEGTVLIAMYGGFNQIGRTGILRIPAAVNQAITAVQTKSTLHSEYLLATLNYRVDYWKSVASSSRKDPNITSQDVRSFKISFPPIKEQRAIAAALSSMDALISCLDQLIAKKRDIKQASMQQLLTGQKRLPGFSGEWKVKPLSSVLSKGRLGGNYGNQDAETKLPLMKMGNLARGYFDLSKVQFIMRGVSPDPIHRLVYGDVLFNTRNTLDLVGKVAIWRDELPIAYYNSNLMRLEFDTEQICSNEYANYALNTASMVSELREMATGSTSVAAIYTRDLMRLRMLVPPLPEQTAIATILSDMDSELATLETRRDKVRQLKQGMMQELLTGRIRFSQSSQEAKLC